MSADRRTIARLRAALRGSNRHVRAEAAIALAEAGDREAMPEIEGMTADADDLTAVAGLFAWWRLEGKVRGIERLAAALASEDEETMQLAVQALCAIGEDAVPALERALAEDSPVKVEIVRVLGDIGGPRALRVVARAANADDAAVAREARAILEGEEGP